jgi:hypothetical protein
VSERWIRAVWVAGFGLFLGATETRALPIDLSLVVASQTPTAIEVEVRIAGLVDSALPSLRGYDLTITFPAALLDFDDVVGFSSLLTPPGSSGSIEGTGTVEIAQLSSHTVATLTTQPDSFVLATLRFVPIGVGTANLGFDLEAVGTSLTGVDVDEGLVDLLPSLGTVTGTSVEVPEPALLVLITGGLAATARTLRRRG